MILIKRSSITLSTLLALAVAASARAQQTPTPAPPISVTRYSDRALSEYQTQMMNEATKLSFACRKPHGHPNHRSRRSIV